MKNKKSKIILILILTVISVLFIAPIVIVFMNSFKSKLFINSTPFAFPNADSFVGLANYGEGMIKTGFLQAFFITLFITVASVFLIVVLTSMTAWYLVRVKSRFTKVMYYVSFGQSDWYHIYLCRIWCWIVCIYVYRFH